MRYVGIFISENKIGTSVPTNAWRIDSDDDMKHFVTTPIPDFIRFDKNISVNEPQHSAGVIGFCIYCGNGATGDEHIIPKGMGGSIYLERASCQTCANKINSFEGSLVNTLFDAPRKRLGVKRRRKRLPNDATITTYEGDIETDRKLPPGKHPSVLVLPSLRLPGVIEGRPPQITGVDTIWMCNMDNKGAFNESALTNYWTPTLDLTKFAQLLAKIAYSYFMTQAKVEKFVDNIPIIRGQVVPFILKQFRKSDEDKEHYYLVGGQMERYVATEYMHQIGFGIVNNGIHPVRRRVCQAFCQF